MHRPEVGDAFDSSRPRYRNRWIVRTGERAGALAAWSWPAVEGRQKESASAAAVSAIEPADGDHCPMPGDACLHTTAANDRDRLTEWRVRA